LTRSGLRSSAFIKKAEGPTVFQRILPVHKKEYLVHYASKNVVYLKEIQDIAVFGKWKTAISEGEDLMKGTYHFIMIRFQPIV
jgi:hypothetical protein